MHYASGVLLPGNSPWPPAVTMYSLKALHPLPPGIHLGHPQCKAKHLSSTPLLALHRLPPPPSPALPQPPEVYFGHPQYAAVGNLFWPSAWQGQVKDSAYQMHGLKPEATKVWGCSYFMGVASNGGGAGVSGGEAVTELVYNLSNGDCRLFSTRARATAPATQRVGSYLLTEPGTWTCWSTYSGLTGVGWRLSVPGLPRSTLSLAVRQS